MNLSQWHRNAFIAIRGFQLYECPFCYKSLCDIRIIALFKEQRNDSTIRAILWALIYGFFVKSFFLCDF